MSAQNMTETQTISETVPLKSKTSPSTSKKRSAPQPAVWFDQITPNDLSDVPKYQRNTFEHLVNNAKGDGRKNIRVTHYENIGPELVEALKTFVRTSRPPPAKKQKKDNPNASSTKKDKSAILAKVVELFGEMPTNQIEAETMEPKVKQMEDVMKEGRKRRKLCQDEGWLPKPEPRNRKASKASTDGKETDTATTGLNTKTKTIQHGQYDVVMDSDGSAGSSPPPVPYPGTN